GHAEHLRRAAGADQRHHLRRREGFDVDRLVEGDLHRVLAGAGGVDGGDERPVEVVGDGEDAAALGGGGQDTEGRVQLQIDHRHVGQADAQPGPVGAADVGGVDADVGADEDPPVGVARHGAVVDGQGVGRDVGQVAADADPADAGVAGQEDVAAGAGA